GLQVDDLQAAAVDRLVDPVLAFVDAVALDGRTLARGQELRVVVGAAIDARAALVAPAEQRSVVREAPDPRVLRYTVARAAQQADARVHLGQAAAGGGAAQPGRRAAVDVVAPGAVLVLHAVALEVLAELAVGVRRRERLADGVGRRRRPPGWGGGAGS